MTTVLKPKYSIPTIQTRFFARTQSTPLGAFLADNFEIDTGSVNNQSITLPSQTIDPNFLASILADYGNGPISQGMDSLALINQNVLVGVQQSSDIFGNAIIAYGDVDFKSVAKDYGREIVLANLRMTNVVPLAAAAFQSAYYSMIDNIVIDLKSGKYTVDKYKSGLLNQSKQIARSLLNK